MGGKRERTGVVAASDSSIQISFTHKGINCRERLKLQPSPANLKRAGVRYRRPYQTRHTFASMMLTAGESPIWIAAQMGHADTGMIYRKYGRWITDAAPQAGTKAVEMFAGKSCDKAAIAS